MKIWISRRVERLITEFFGECGLKDDVIKTIQNLPGELADRVGLTVEFGGKNSARKNQEYTD